MLLDVKNLDISYGSKLTVSGVNIQLDKGEILSIVGESGSGKTTVIRAVMGCLPGRGHVSGGSITFDGRDMLKNTREDWRKISGSEMSMIFQDSGNMINPIRRIGEQFTDYILAHAPQKSKAEAAEMAKDMLNKVRLPNPQNIMNSYPFELSGGMRQRVGIAMAMIFSPKLLLADEPTSALDVTTQAQIIREIVDVRNEYNAAVILVTHNIGVASYVSNKLMVMKNGHVKAAGAKLLKTRSTPIPKNCLRLCRYWEIRNIMNAEAPVILQIKNLTKKFAAEGGKMLTACDNVTLNAYAGQTLGIIGESGCGKSTLVRTILQIHPASGGEVIFDGQDILKLRGEAARQNRRKIQMVFQDPAAAFNPKMKVKEIVCEPLLNFGLIKKSEVDAKAAELLRMVELPEDFKDRYPHNMSGGQRQRLGIARALSLEPKIVVCDEATSALDVSVQEKICELLVRLQKEKGITYLFICHDLGLVDLMCHQIAVMYLGNIVEYIGYGRRISTEGMHPYTKALMKSVFKVDFKPGEKIEPLESEIPSPLDLPKGCPFQSRCGQCMEICRSVKPELKEVVPGHFVACHLVNGNF